MITFGDLRLGYKTLQASVKDETVKQKTTKIK